MPHCGWGLGKHLVTFGHPGRYNANPSKLRFVHSTMNKLHSWEMSQSPPPSSNHPFLLCGSCRCPEGRPPPAPACSFLPFLENTLTLGGQLAGELLSSVSRQVCWWNYIWKTMQFPPATSCCKSKKKLTTYCQHHDSWNVSAYPAWKSSFGDDFPNS